MNFVNDGVPDSIPSSSSWKQPNQYLSMGILAIACHISEERIDALLNNKMINNPTGNRMKSESKNKIRDGSRSSWNENTRKKNMDIEMRKE